MQVLADFARYKFENFFILQKTTKNFEDISKNQKLSHKNAIKGHIFGDADFADF